MRPTPRKITPRKITLLLSSISIAILFVACGGGGDSGSTTSTGTSTSSTPTSGTPSQTPTGPTLLSMAVVDGTPIGTSQWTNGDTQNGGQGASAGGLNCGRPGASYTYAHLSIFRNGQQVALPAEIGSVSPSSTNTIGCFYPVRTDDTSGKIRFDTSTGATYNLGQFFAVWGQPLSASKVADLSEQVTAVYINDGNGLVPYTGDPASLPLTSHREITIVLGTAPSQIPTYQWSDPPPLSATPVAIPTPNGILGTDQPWTDGDTAQGGQGQVVDGLACGSMNGVLHVHAHLSIFSNGVQQRIPTNIGIPSCMYPLHTHDATGIIHIESPTFQRITLGQFFDIWGQPLTVTNVAEQPSTITNVGGFTGMPIVVYINDNGDLRQYMGDPRNIELFSHRAITIQIGSRLPEIQTYTWGNFGTSE